VTPAMPVPVDETHFGPVGKALGLQTIDRGRGSVTAAITCAPELLNLPGALHGGIGAMVANVACASALDDVASYRQLSAHCSYLAPAGAAGAVIMARAKIAKTGRRFTTVDAELAGADGRIALRLTSTWARRAESA
jgi:uncharacterized protein (TIGR00369 family)